jgi:hypothetical protein
VELGDIWISLKLRDRDAIVVGDTIIFRVYGYFHPSKAYICDPEYASAEIYKSDKLKAFRVNKNQSYYKFFEDEGLNFIYNNYPHFTLWHAPLQTRLVGVKESQIIKTRKPEKAFKQLFQKPAKDNLIHALQTLSNIIIERTGLSETHFGVFGSLLHGFYHPQYSDLDLIIYGKEPIHKLSQTLQVAYREDGSQLQNEFKSVKAINGKSWKFINYNPKEFVWHQKRKLIYALFDDKKSQRLIKTEFEPVKQWEEIQNEYNTKIRILKRGWIKAVVRITDDSNAPFIPSIYLIEPLKISTKAKTDNIKRIISFIEEFRMQVKKDEEVFVEGNLEQVITPQETFHQITLTYGPHYYEQVLKVLEGNNVKQRLS